MKNPGDIMKIVEPVSCILCHCKKTKPYEQMCPSACEYVAMSEWAKSVWLETKPSLPIVSHTDFCYSTTATLFSTKWGIKRYHADILWYLQYEKVFFQKHLIPLCSFGSSLCGKKLSSELFPLWLVVFVARLQGEIQVRYTKSTSAAGMKWHSSTQPPPSLVLVNVVWDPLCWH